MVSNDQVADIDSKHNEYENMVLVPLLRLRDTNLCTIVTRTGCRKKCQILLSFFIISSRHLIALCASKFNYLSIGLSQSDFTLQHHHQLVSRNKLKLIEEITNNYVRYSYLSTITAVILYNVKNLF